MQFVGTRRFGGKEWGDDRLVRTLKAYNYFGWTEGSQVLSALQAWLKGNGERLEVQLVDTLAVLKKGGFTDALSGLGKVSLISPLYEDEALGERVRRWLVTPRQALSGRSGTVLDIVRSNIRGVLYSGKQTKARGLSFDNFLEERSWLRSGATSWPDMVPKGYERVKSAIGLNHTVAEVKARILKDLEKGWSEMAVIPKVEPITPRGVVKADDSGYLFLSWCMHYVYPFLENSPYLHQAKTSEEKFKFWRTCQSLIPHAQAIDLDFSQWDESMLKEVVMYVMDYFVRLACSLGGSLYGMDELWSSFRVYFENARISINTIDGRKEWLAWGNGLPSGLLLTWFINAVVNICLAKQMCEDLGFRYRVLTAQGDDLHVVAEGVMYDDLARIVSWYEEVGYVVHPTKSKISRDDGGEFLKMNVKEDSIHGDKWRMLRTILWGQSERDEVDLSSMKAKMSERVNIWLQYSLRGGEINEDDVVRDLFGAGSNKVGKKKIQKALRTSTALGGFGLFGNDTDVRITWKDDMIMTDRIFVRLKPSRDYTRSRSWVKGMISLLKGVKLKKMDKLPATAVTVDKRSFSFRTNRYPLEMRIGISLPESQDSTPRIFSIGKVGKARFDDTTELSALDYGDRPTNAHVAPAVSWWKNHCTRAMWPEVIKSGGMPKVGMSPVFARKFGEQLASLAWDRLSSNVLTYVCRAKLDQFSFTNAAWLVSDHLPRSGWSLF